MKLSDIKIFFESILKVEDIIIDDEFEWANFNTAYFDSATKRLTRKSPYGTVWRKHPEVMKIATGGEQFRWILRYAIDNVDMVETGGAVINIYYPSGKWITAYDIPICRAKINNDYNIVIER